MAHNLATAAAATGLNRSTIAARDQIRQDFRDEPRAGRVDNRSGRADALVRAARHRFHRQPGAKAVAACSRQRAQADGATGNADGAGDLPIRFARIEAELAGMQQLIEAEKRRAEAAEKRADEIRPSAMTGNSRRTASPWPRRPRRRQHPSPAAASRR